MVMRIYDFIGDTFGQRAFDWMDYHLMSFDPDGGEWYIHFRLKGRKEW